MMADRRSSRQLSIRTWLVLGALSVLVVFLIGNVLAQRGTHLAVQSVSRLERRFEPLARIARDLEDAIVAYDHAVSSYVKLESDDNAAAMAVAGAQLEVAVAEYRRIAGPAAPHGAPASLVAGIAVLQRDGEALAGAQKARSQLVAAYWSALGKLRNRFARTATTGLDADGSVVVARRSLAELARAAAALGDAAAAQFTGASPRAAAEAARREDAFRAILRVHLAELRRSPGAVWLELLTEDLAALIEARRMVARLDSDLEPQRLALAARVMTLRGDVRRSLQEPAWDALAESARHARVTAEAASRTIAVVSVAVLALVLLLWVAAVRGVTGPVRRLIEGTRRLATGALGTRVARGGVSELDELAQSFNEMAARLAESERAVRSHQAELERRVHERTRQLQHLAHHDPLTELPNRRELFSHLGRVLPRARHTESGLAVLFIDLDNFKTINDSLGHEFGDRVLREIGRRLCSVASGSDFVGRLGGDEFTVVLNGLASTAEMQQRVAALITAFQRPLEVEHRELMIGVSIGVALCPDHGEDAESLLRAADSALFRAKELGRNRWCVYSPELFTAASERFQTEQSLRRAIDAGEFTLHYQPEVSLTTREATVVEALLRWRLASGRLATAGEFLGVAEHAGLMLDLGDWTLSQAVAAVRDWRQQGWPGARVAVNASSQQFLRSDFVASIERALRTTSMPAGCLELELTETALQTGAVTVEALQELRRLGVSIALDDFGAGFSSLGSIERLPLTRVKLDRSLIAGVDSNSRSAAITRSIVSLCRGLGLQVTAEGVERPTQLEFLAGCGDVHVQGYLVARPEAAERIVELVRGTRAQLAMLGSQTVASSGDDSGRLVTLRPRRS